MGPGPSALVAAAAAALAWRARTLTAGGAIAAALVGTAVLWGGGAAGAAALVTFFLSAALLGRFGTDPAAAAGEAKGDTRDAGQVFANGGGAALAALAAALALADPARARWAIVASLAVAAADTWATAVGGTSTRPPRDLRTWRPAAAGTSGAVSARGTAAGAAGALVVALAAAGASRDWHLVLPVTAVGWIGMLLDSAVGATLQVRYHCPACNVTTERPLHRCGARASRMQGWPWLDNDGVNAVATITGALLGAVAWRVFGAAR